ncbi:MAG: hypothetical protein M3Q36_03345 [bacterium]|nr:hypothetical protein [bacterium]
MANRMPISHVQSSKLAISSPLAALLVLLLWKRQPQLESEDSSGRFLGNCHRQRLLDIIINT